ncbi:PqqD family peptide modification chaperone, partial [Thermodesulfobacteriota bacterium]
VVFMANHYPTSNFPLSEFRKNIAVGLHERYGDRFGLYGQGWQDVLPNVKSLMYQQDIEAETYRKSKMAVNISHFDLSRFSSDRLFRIMACGPLCLCKRYKDCEVDFTDGVHLRYWDTEGQLYELIDYYSKDENNAERERIAKNGNQLVTQHCKWSNRMQELKTLIKDDYISTRNKFAKTQKISCAVIIPIGPGHLRIAGQAESSVYRAINCSMGAFQKIEIIKIDDTKGEKGRAQARNSAIDLCLKQNYQWLFFLDADDLICENAFEVVSDLTEHYDAVWGSILEIPSGHAEANIVPHQSYPTNFDQLLLCDDPSSTLQTGHFVKSNVAASIRFDEQMSECAEFDCYSKVWKSYKCMKIQSPLFVKRRGMESEQLHSVSKSRRMQPIASIIGKHKHSPYENLDFIPAWSKEYQNEKNKKRVFEKLTKSRRMLADYYIESESDTFRTALEFTEDAYLALMGSGIKNQPLPADEQNFINSLFDQDVDHSKGLQYFFVMMLYCSPHQLPKQWRSRLSIPKWSASYLYAWLNKGNRPTGRRPKITDDIEINLVEDGYVIYQTAKDHVHYLNHTAAVVLESCTGNHSEEEIVQIVKQAFDLSEPPEKEVRDCLDSLLEQGLVK